MEPASIFVGDLGTIFRITVKDQDGVAIDLSLATVKKMKFLKPSKTLATKDASFATDGADGVMQYIAETGDISEAGSWEWQGYVEVAGGKWHTTKFPFEVRAPLT